jgi:hypothetical protein
MGLPGAPGLPGRDGVSGYEVVIGDTPLFNAGRNVDIGEFQLNCPSGKVAISGGHQMLNTAAHGLTVMTSAPYNAAGISGWRLDVENVHSPIALMQARVRIFVVCATMAQ